MDTYLFNVITTLWLVAAALPVVSATKICYNSFGTFICRDRLPVHERIGLWILFLSVLALVIGTFLWWLRRRASRQRDAIATVEANQIHGPASTPFESGFVQVHPPVVSYPTQPYNNPYGPRTAAPAQSAYSVGFTPSKNRNLYQTDSQYSTTPEEVLLAPPPPPTSSARGIRTGGLPGSPRPIIFHKKGNETTPRDKNTRFVIPELIQTGVKRDKRELEALRTAPVKKITFEGIVNPPIERPMQSRSAGVTTTFSSKLRPLFAGTSRSKEFV